jgi:hypothetical protein
MLFRRTKCLRGGSRPNPLPDFESSLISSLPHLFKEVPMSDMLELTDAGLDESVVLLDFSKLTWKLLHNDEGTNLAADEVELAEREYRRFLTLKRLYPQRELVPNKLVDAFWHAHILDTRSYQADCQKVFGYYLHHYPYFGIHDADDRKALDDAFAETQRVYELHFGNNPAVDSDAARCKDHSCHAPSSCACRTPGACK